MQARTSSGEWTQDGSTRLSALGCPVCLECQDATLEQVERAAGALRELLWNADEATRTLSELCARNGIQHVQVDRPGS
jgi:hypothetical protein